MNPETTPTPRVLPAIGRILMGLPFVIFGLNAFLNFIPPPAKPMPAEAAAFAGALMKSGYMMQLIGADMLVVGVLLLANRFVPLALVLIAPFLVNSLAFHLALQPGGLAMAGPFCVIELYLLWVYRRHLAGLLTARAAP